MVEQGPDGRRLAGAVRAEEAEGFAFFDLQVDIDDPAMGSIGLGELFRPDDGIHDQSFLPATAPALSLRKRSTTTGTSCSTKAKTSRSSCSRARDVRLVPRGCRSHLPPVPRDGGTRSRGDRTIDRPRHGPACRSFATSSLSSNRRSRSSSTDSSARGQARSNRQEGLIMDPVIQTEQLTKTYGSHRGSSTSTRGRRRRGLRLPRPERRRQDDDHPRSCSTTSARRAGRATVFGIDTTADPVAIHRRLGYLPGEFALYDKLTGGQTIEYFANLRGGVDTAYQQDLIAAPRRRPEPEVPGVLEGQQAEDRPRRRPPAPAGPAASSTSRRPAWTRWSSRRSTRSSARPRPRAGRSSCRPTSSREVEKTCDRVAIIRDGRLVKVDRVEALRDLAHHQVELRFAGDVPVGAFAALPGVSDVVAEDHTPPDARVGHDHAGRPRGRQLRARSTS